MTIRQRIYLGFASIILFVTVFSILVVVSMGSMNDNTRHIGNKLYAKVEYAHNAMLSVERIDAALAEMLLLDDPSAPLATVENSMADLATLHERLEPLIETPQGKSNYQRAIKDFMVYNEAMQQYLTLATSGDYAGARLHLQYDVQPKRSQLEESLGAFAAYQEGLMAERVDSSERQNERTQVLVWGGLALLVVFIVFTAIGVVRNTIRSIRSISKVMDEAERLESSAMLPRMHFRATDETETIVRAYNKMADTIEKHAAYEAAHHRLLQDRNWVQSNVAAVMDACQGARTVDLFGERLLSHVVPAASAVTGALHYADPFLDADRYVRVAAYASDPQADPARIAFRRGEGLVGQCAEDGVMIERAAPPDYLRVVSGVGSGAATYVLLLPIRYENSVIAVLELGAFEPFSALAKECLKELAAGNIGVSLQSISNHQRIQTLLSDAQSYNEELQAQSEELQQQQEELRSLNEKLAEQFRYSEQRGQELERTRAELEAQALELQASSQFKSEFLANISHELRTPLNSLLILAQMLSDDAENRLSGRQREYAQTILFSGNELLALINDVLDLSKIEAGQMFSSEEAISLEAFAADTERQFRSVAEQRSLAFNVSLDPELAAVPFVSDPRMLQQIVNNLLSNAFKFTEAGAVSLKIGREDAGRGGLPEEPLLVSFQVADTGIGIPPEKHDLIFEAFRQADGKTTRKFGGTGLGLSISRELARILGGSIRLRSEEGSGSTFTAVIPMRPLRGAGALEAAATTPLSPTLPPQPPIETFLRSEPQFSPDANGAGAATILLVDDDIRNVYALTAALNEHGYRVEFAEDGAAALHTLERRDDIDLVLMDMMMPGIDGYEAMRSIRMMPRFAKLPIIALTAKAMKQDRDLCLAAGADDYLGKPVKLDKLLSLLRVWLDGGEAGGARSDAVGDAGEHADE